MSFDPYWTLVLLALRFLAGVIGIRDRGVAKLCSKWGEKYSKQKT